MVKKCIVCNSEMRPYRRKLCSSCYSWCQKRGYHKLKDNDMYRVLIYHKFDGNPPGKEVLSIINSDCEAVQKNEIPDFTINNNTNIKNNFEGPRHGCMCKYSTLDKFFNFFIMKASNIIKYLNMKVIEMECSGGNNEK